MSDDEIEMVPLSTGNIRLLIRALASERALATGTYGRCDAAYLRRIDRLATRLCIYVDPNEPA